MRNKFTCLLLIAVFIFISPTTFAKNTKNADQDLVNLGKAIYNDLNLSANQNQSCMTCHHPAAGFADPENRVMPTLFPVSDGSVLDPSTLLPLFFGGRNAPTAAYAGFSPIFHYDSDEGLFIGGLFWDGRATGRMDFTATGDLGAGPTGDPLADQAKGPFANDVEMSTIDSPPGYATTEEAVIAIIQASDYADKFEKEFGPDAFADVLTAYNNASIAIAAFERSNTVNGFQSKFDKFVAEQGGDVSTFGVFVEADGFRTYVGPGEGFKSKVYSYDEADGLAIFNADSYTQMDPLHEPAQGNGGQCYLCHLTENHEVDASDPNYPANGPTPGIYNPILTDFTYDNLGIPVNPRIAVLQGATSPLPADLGLGGQVDQLNTVLDTDVPVFPDEEGKFKVSSLRNLSRTAPYGHNGFFATIYDIVHFYNTRDVLNECTSPSDPGLGTTCWPAPEVSSTVNGDELGDLGLTTLQEQKLVLFLETLSD